MNREMRILEKDYGMPYQYTSVIKDQFVKQMPELSFSFRCGRIQENDCHEFCHTQNSS
jgi:hypothetical protein